MNDIDRPGEDLELDAAEESGGDVEQFAPPPIVPYNPDKVRDAVRGRIALSLIAILGVTIVWSLWLIYAAPWHSERLVEVLKLVFAPLTTLVGAATGYYYGAGSASAQSAGRPAGPRT